MTTSAANHTDVDRIELLDILRGVAVLGILAINIISFGVPYGFSVVTIPGGQSAPNIVAWLVNAIFVEGTMRGIFAMLFGVGIVIYTRNLERSGHPQAADLHVRRMFWILVFGLVNSHLLLWRGDILFEYALTGLLAYGFRNFRPRLLLTLAALGLLFVTARGYSEWRYLGGLEAAARPAIAAEDAGRALSGDMKSALDAWRKETQGSQPTVELLGKNIATMRGDFRGIFRFVTTEITDQRTITYYRHGFFETLSTMLLGMALFHLGALSGRWSRRQYIALTLGGYGIGLSVNALEAMFVMRSGFDPLTIEFTQLVSYQLGRATTAVGHIGFIALLCQPGVAGALRSRLAAVGRMALTNYLAQSLICLVLFTGVGFGLYGKLQRFELYYVVLAVWCAQLLWSRPWLSRCQQGPLERLWRTLTHWSPSQPRAG